MYVDNVTVWVIILPLVFILGMITEQFIETEFYSAACTTALVASVFLRMGVLRLANQGDVPLLAVPSNNWVITFLASDECFLGVSASVAASLVWFILDSNKKLRELRQRI